MKYALIAALLTGADQVIKTYVEHKSKDVTNKRICKGKVMLKQANNQGFANGRMKEDPEFVRFVTNSVLVATTVASIPVLGSKKKRPITKLGTAMVIAGAASNVIDRNARGYVVDYLQVDTDLMYSEDWKLPKPVKSVLKKSNEHNPLRNKVFNLADVMIIVGTGMAIVPRLFRK